MARGCRSTVPGETVNRVCGSGLAAVMHAADAIAAGTSGIVVAGGTESMSNAPYLLKGARWGYRMGHAEVVDVMVGEGLTCAIEGCHMGTTAEAVAARYGITRSAQDAFAAESQRRAGAAQEAGWFADEIVPVTLPQKKGDPVVVSRDEYPRPGTTAEKLGGAEAGVSERRHGHGRQRLGHQRRRRGAGRRRRARRPRASAARRWRASLAYATAGVEPMLHGTGAGARRAQGRDARGPRVGRRRPVRAQRGVCRTGACRRAGPRASIPRGSTSEAAPSRSVIPSAPAARACW